MALLRAKRREIRLFSKSNFWAACAKLAGMKSINSAFNGLASSLLLNVGLTRVAEKLDAVSQNKTKIVVAKKAIASTPCVYPCYFTPESGQ